MACLAGANRGEERLRPCGLTRHEQLGRIGGTGGLVLGAGQWEVELAVCFAELIYLMHFFIRSQFSIIIQVLILDFVWSQKSGFGMTARRCIILGQHCILHCI